MALLAMLGPSIRNVIIAISVASVPNMVRVVRSSVLSLRDQPFVDAARAIGARPSRILLRHISPNTVAPVTVQATFLFAAAILTEAGLSFIGAGIPPFIPSWGNIISDGRNFLQVAFWIVFFPGVFLALTVLAVNLLGDGIRDLIDPKLRRLA
jgi:peptide/nickel transport system permease protein